MKSKILLVDDHPVFRKGLKLLLEQEKMLKVVGEAGDGQVAIELVREKQPEVVVMDITMPNLNGIETTRQILEEFPSTKVVALSIHSGKRFVENMLRAGAVGYILKESVPEELLNGVKKVIAGDMYLSDEITGVLVSQYHKATGKTSENAGAEPLSKKEKTYLQLIAGEKPSQQIMDTLGVNLEAFDEMSFSVMEKLGVENEADLFEKAKSIIFYGEPATDLGKNLSPVTVMKTKLVRPILPAGYIARTVLINQLEQHCDLPLTLVSAPAGYGKSVLIGSCLESFDRPSAWFSIDEKDNDLQVFLIHFLEAVRTIFPAAVSETFRLCNAPDLPSLDVLTQSLLNELHAIKDKYILVLDDIHLIHDPSVYELIASLIRHPALTLHLVVCGRRDPFLPLSKLRANNQMNEIRVRDLRFSIAETSRFLEQELGKPIDSLIAGQWADKTEGWITGLRLAVLSIRQRGEYESLLPELTGGIQYITEYLFNEVLISQTPEIREYLLASSILGKFSAPLCDALVVKEDPPVNPEFDGWRFIDFLKKENIFIIYLDTENYWFRYHHLFQHLLQNQLKRYYTEIDIAKLHSRASQWFFENNQIEEAIDHAVKSGDTDDAAVYIEKNRQSLHDADKWFVLRNWLALLPDPVVRQRPQLLMAQAWVLYHQFKFFEILPLMDTVESLISMGPEDDALIGEVDFFRGYCNYFSGNGEPSFQHLQSALNKIPESHHEIRGQAELVFGLASQMQGQQEKAVRRLNDLLNDNQSIHSLRKTRILVSLVYMYIISGELDDAVQVNNQLMDVAIGNDYSYAGIWGIYLKGLIHFYRNEIDESIDCFQQVKKDRYILHTRAAIDAIAGLSFAWQLKGQSENANAEMRFLYEFVASFKGPGYHLLADACQTRLAIMQENSKTVRHWLKNNSLPDAEVMAWWNEIPAVTYCRALLFEGSSSNLLAAGEKLEQYLKLNQSHHNVCHQIEILILLALISQKQKAENNALDLIEQAVTLASPAGFIQPFIETGPQIVTLLENLAQKQVEVRFINELFAIFSTENQGNTATALEDQEKPLQRALTDDQPLVEPLTNREIDILELLSKRLQNKEIAEKLFISPETVKKHLQNVYQKLNAANRREAVENARNLGILTYR